MPTDPDRHPIPYYDDPAVRARIVEFLGGSSAQAFESVTAVYVTGDDGAPGDHFDPQPPDALGGCLDRGLDVGRSLWDRESLVADLEIEYVNFDAPAQVYLEPVRAFELQEPVARAIKEVLVGYGGAALHYLTGRGHHFVWRVRRGSAAFHRLWPGWVMSPSRCGPGTPGGRSGRTR